jgi:hypothetical protein
LQTELTRSWLPTQLLEHGSQRVQFGAKAAPVPNLQAINCPIIMSESVTGSLVHRARGRGPGACRQGGTRDGFLEQRHLYGYFGLVRLTRLGRGPSWVKA